MRKLTLLLSLMLLIGLQAAFAQRTITGKVTSSEDGSSIPGATVLVKGTTVGAITDLDGNYKLAVPAGKDVIMVSYVGMKTVEITLGDQDIINVVLTPEIVELEGVVITALGVTREKKALGYSVQDLKGDQLNQDGAGSVISSLSGKVSGVQINTGAGAMGGSSRVLIRGVNSINGNNNPLFIIDGVPIDNSDFNSYSTSRGAGGYDYGNMAQDINPDNIESMSVLKGANAAALYGSRAANGVILITTKKGEQQKGKLIGIDFSTGLNFEQVAYLPDYQTTYGGGNGGLGGSWEIKYYTDESGHYKVSGVDADGNPFNSFDLGMDYGIDESWGPAYASTAGEFIPTQDFGYTLDAANQAKFDELYGTKPIYYRAYNSFQDWDTENYGKSIEWKKPANGAKEFFQTGLGWQNSIAFTGGSEKATFRLGLNSLNSSGYMPNSELDKYTVSFSGKANLTQKLSAFTDMTYINTQTKGRPETGYGDLNPMERINQWGQTQLDYETMKTYINPDGSQISWNRVSMDDPTPNYSDNPYWARNMCYENDIRNRLYGNVGLSWAITDWLTGRGKLNLDTYTFQVYERVAVGSAAQSFFRQNEYFNSEFNAEYLLLFDKTFAKDWRITGNIGGNYRNQKYRSIASTTVGGLFIPELYTLSNAPSNSSLTEQTWKRVNSLYGSASFGWRSMIYVDVTARNDWSSTLPESDNSYFYPSVSVSWVFSELKPLKEAKWLTFGKIRGGWAKVGNDTDPYNILRRYANMLDADGYPYQFGSLAMYTLPTTLNNPKLRPETTKSWELGAELKFINNRIGLDFTYYSKNTIDQILPVAISGATGYSFKLMNAGEISNKGIEAMLTLVPIRYKDKFEWTLTGNFGKNKNDVVSLTEGIENLQLGVGPFNISVNALVGQPYGQLMGTDFIYDANGNKVVDQDGRYLKTSDVRALGSVLPDWNLGIGNQFKIFGFKLGCLIDIQHGGHFFSTTKMWGTYSGILAASAEGTMREDGVVIDAPVAKYDANGDLLYNADGETVQVEDNWNTTVLDARIYCSDFYDGPAAQNVLDASYVKLRELTLSYTIPTKYTGPVHNLNIGLYGRNLATWGVAMKGIDPESATTSAGNVQGIEGACLPSLRNFGFNISFNF